MFILKKKVGGITYYWNDDHKWWEGLYCNATPLESTVLNAIYSELLKKPNAEDYSFTKI